ncbi:MAG: DinB family protein [Anaerolineae bacterium]
MQSEALYTLLFKTANEHLEATVADVNDDVANWVPEKTVASIGAQYVHILTSMDAIVNALLKGGAPLMATTFAGKIGAAEAPQLFTWGEWGRSSKVNLAQARAYAQAVYASIYDYLSGQTDESLAETVDLTGAGLGVMPRAVVLEIALRQPYVHAGEISALKGLQGMKGYPV